MLNNLAVMKAAPTGISLGSLDKACDSRYLAGAHTPMRLWILTPWMHSLIEDSQNTKNAGTEQRSGD